MKDSTITSSDVAKEKEVTAGGVHEDEKMAIIRKQNGESTRAGQQGKNKPGRERTEGGITSLL